MQSSTAFPERGKTFFQGQDAPASADFGKTAQHEGVCAIFAENAVDKEGASLRKRPTGRYTKCMLVRNTHASTTFDAGKAVRWESGYRKRRCDDYAADDDVTVAGIVDDKLTQGARPGDLFWIMREGFAKCFCADKSSYVVNDAIGCTTSGVCDTDVAVDRYTIGHVITGVEVISNSPTVEVDLAILN